jgi:hypothetical protein
MLAWSAAVAFAEKLVSFPTPLRGGLAVAATIVAVGWSTAALCPSTVNSAGFRPARQPALQRRWTRIAGMVLVLAAVGGACWALGVAVVEFPSLVFIEHRVSGFPQATQIEVRPPHTDAPAAFSLQLWSGHAQGGELPCRCQDWNPVVRTSCATLDWRSDSVTFVVRELRSPARLGIWCDRRVEAQLTSISAASVLYGSSLQFWSWMLLATGGIAWIVGSYACWRWWRA